MRVLSYTVGSSRRRGAGDVKPRKLTSVPQSVKLKAGETVMFPSITYKSRAHRDRMNKKVMARIAGMDMKTVPFDAKRMIYGGFSVLVQG